MIRLYIVVEGQTEESFVKELLAPHLWDHGVSSVPIIVSTSRKAGGRKRRGGGHWKSWKADLIRILGEQVPGGGRVTTMFDLYGLPQDYPDLARIRDASTSAAKVQLAEEAMRQDLRDVVGVQGLVPYVQQHEYEALVLACLDELCSLLDAPSDLAGVARLRHELGNTPPEEVNDGIETAPSKRLERFIPGYDKLLHGELTLANVRLSKLMEQCPHFGGWVRRLEGLKPAGS